METWYWGAIIKIQQNPKCQFDDLYKKRVVTVLFSCNKRVTNSTFKAKLDNYGYNQHGFGALNTAVLRHNHLLKDPKVMVTINFRECCRCTAKQLSKKNYHQKCEKHSKKQISTKSITKKQKTITCYFKQKK